MKNFPHQVTDPSKLREALRLAAELKREGYDTRDDDVLGYALARGGVYSFRSFDGDLEARIAQERKKPVGRQGARTAARDIRRTLNLLGWLDATGNVTAEGLALLATDPATAEEKAVWRHALWQLELETVDGVSHPARILVRLADAAAFNGRTGMELAFEAADDTQKELFRVSGLRGLSDVELQEKLAIGEATIANARKILPRFAEYAELLVLNDVGEYSPTEIARELAALPPSQPSEGPPRGRRRRSGSASEKKSAAEVGAPKNFDEKAWSSLSREEQLDAIKLRSERTSEHQECVRTTAAAVEHLGSLHEQATSYDLVVALSQSELLLIEVKTIRSDAPEQIRRAIGQLAYYSHFFVKPQWPEATVVPIIVVDAEIAEDLVGFVDTLSVALFLCGKQGLISLNETATRLAGELGLDS